MGFAALYPSYELNDAQILQGGFSEDHVDQVKAAFARRGLTYHSNDIASCVKALLADGK